jgi:hypothetical protein
LRPIVAVLSSNLAVRSAKGGSFDFREGQNFTPPVACGSARCIAPAGLPFRASDRTDVSRLRPGVVSPTRQRPKKRAECAAHSDRRLRLRRIRHVRPRHSVADRRQAGGGEAALQSFPHDALRSPTRAALITGRNHHSASFAGITELATGYDGYCCVLPRNCRTVGESLRLRTRPASREANAASNGRRLKLPVVRKNRADQLHCFPFQSPPAHMQHNAGVRQ